MRRLAGSLLRGLLLTLGLFGCGKGDAGGDPPRPCSADSECQTGQECKLIGPGSKTMVVAPPLPCPYTGCTGAGGCSSGQVCAPIKQAPPGSIPSSPNGSSCPPTLCLPPCQSSGCPAGETCRESGLCELVRCDLPDAVACPEHWRCDPDAAATEPTTITGSDVAEPSDVPQLKLRGCVRKRCDEADGYVCSELWRCAPSETANGSGCDGIPCSESGRCSDDTSFICVPTSSKGRRPGKDAHGCAQRNCEEGLACKRFVQSTDVGYCDFDGPNADLNGCAMRPCSEVDGLCTNAQQTCDPGSAKADARGCRPLICTDPATPCTTNQQCDPASPSANVRGCVPNAAGGGSGGYAASAGAAGTSNRGGNGGAGGATQGKNGGASGATTQGQNGGSSGAATSGSGGASSGGSPSQLDSSGQCVDR